MQDILVNIIYFKESLLKDNGTMISVDIVLAQLPEVIRWLESYELNATSCRYAHYAKYITDSLKEKRHLGALGESEDFNKALKECFYILFVYKVFQYERSQGFRLKLSKVVSGPDFLDSSGVDESRDYLFELVVAANFSQRGYTICFETLTDVVAESLGYSVYVECKRVSSAKQFEKNLKKAGKQLDRELEASKEGRYGLIFMDISALLSSNMQSSVYPSPADGDQKMQQHMDAFTMEKSSQINSGNKRFSDVSLGVCLLCLDLVWTEKYGGFFVNRLEAIASPDATNEMFSILNVVLSRYNEVYQSVMVS